MRYINQRRLEKAGKIFKDAMKMSFMLIGAIVAWAVLFEGIKLFLIATN